MNFEAIPAPEWKSKLYPAWNRLLEEAPESSVFLSPPWISAWWRHFGDGREARLLAAWDDAGQLRGLAPLYFRRLRIAALPGPRVVSLLGDEGVGSEYLGILARAGEEREVYAALAGAIEGEWSLADFRGLREGGASAALLPEILGADAPRRIDREFQPCSWIPLPSDYETYLASLGQKFRTTLRYRTNKLVKNFSVRLVRTIREEELEAHLERFFALHQGRWTAEGHSGSFYYPKKRNFYREVSAEFLRLGWLRFYHLEVDGVVRAAQFGFAFGGVLHSLQEAFDHDFRPPGIGGIGVVLRGMAIRESIAEGLRAYDFLGGVEEFKTRWGTATRQVERVRVGAPGIRGGAAYAATAGLTRLKRWGRDRVPAWVLGARERWKAARRLQRARRTASRTEGGEP